MVTREDLEGWLKSALKDLGGKGKIVEICKWVWKHHERELEGSGDLFYTWQYDIRWAAKRLRDKKIMKSVAASPRNLWELS
jgi:hypothetical protein